MSSYAQTVKNYTINTTSKTITFTDYTTIVLERIALITDVTTGTILFQFNKPSIATGTVSTNVLTLSTLNGAASTDKLRIDYTNATGDPTYETPALPSGAATAANQINGSQQSKFTDGTNIANVLKADGTAAGQNSALVANAFLSTLFTTTTATNVASTDAGNYRWVSVQISSQGAGSTITFQGSNDNSNWNSLGLNIVSSLLATGGTTGNVYSSTTVTGTWAGSLNYRYFRLNVTGITAGTTAGTIIFSALPSEITIPTVASVQNGTWNVGSSSATGSTVPGNAFFTGMKDSAGQLRGLIGAGFTTGVSTENGLVVAPAVFNGSSLDVIKSAPGALATGVGSLAAVPTPAATSLGLTPYFTSSLLATATAIKASSGRLHALYVYNPNTSGVFLQVFNTAVASVTLGTTTPIQSYYIPANGVFEDYFDYSLNFSTAITIAATTMVTGSQAPTTGLVVNASYL